MSSPYKGKHCAKEMCRVDVVESSDDADCNECDLDRLTCFFTNETKTG